VGDCHIHQELNLQLVKQYAKLGFSILKFFGILSITSCSREERHQALPVWQVTKSWANAWERGKRYLITDCTNHPNMYCIQLLESSKKTCAYLQISSTFQYNKLAYIIHFVDDFFTLLTNLHTIGWFEALTYHLFLEDRYTPPSRMSYLTFPQCVSKLLRFSVSGGPSNSSPF